jgi:hypothetical protein
LKVSQEKLRSSNKKLLEIQDELRKSRILLIEEENSHKRLTEEKHGLIVELSIKIEQLLFMQEALNQANSKMARKKARNMYQSLLPNLMYLLSTVFVGIGVNWLTSVPFNSLGWVMVTSGAIMYLVPIRIT